MNPGAEGPRLPTAAAFFFWHSRSRRPWNHSDGASSTAGDIGQRRRLATPRSDLGRHTRGPELIDSAYLEVLKSFNRTPGQLRGPPAARIDGPVTSDLLYLRKKGSPPNICDVLGKDELDYLIDGSHTQTRPAGSHTCNTHKSTPQNVHSFRQEPQRSRRPCIGGGAERERGALDIRRQKSEQNADQPSTRHHQLGFTKSFAPTGSPLQHVYAHHHHQPPPGHGRRDRGRHGQHRWAQREHARADAALRAGRARGDVCAALQPPARVPREPAQAPSA